jgi:hypothetical protein
MGNIEGKVKGKVLRYIGNDQYTVIVLKGDGYWHHSPDFKDEVPLYIDGLEVVNGSWRMVDVSFDSQEKPEDVINAVDSTCALRRIYIQAMEYLHQAGAQFVSVGNFGMSDGVGLDITKQNGKVTAKQKVFLLERCVLK